MPYVTDQSGRRYYVSEAQYLEWRRARVEEQRQIGERAEEIREANRTRSRRIAEGTALLRQETNRRLRTPSRTTRTQTRTAGVGGGISGGGGLGGIRDGSTSIGSPGITDSVDEDMRYATDAELEQYIRSNYGYMAAFIDNPEVRNVLFEAARGGWDESRLYGAISQTDWWQSTSAAQRTWQRLLGEDPAEAQRQVQTAAADIQNRIRSLGINVDNATLSRLATDAVANGWTDAQIIDRVVNNVDWSTLEGGDLTATFDDILAEADAYLVAIDDQTAQNYATRIASGEMTIDGVRSILLDQAKARFGYMADALDGGASVRDYFRPIQNVIATELEIAPDAVNLMDSQWLSLVEQRGEDGQMRAATMHEAQLAARRRPEYARTSGAQETSTNLVSMISDIFGRTGT